MQTTTKSAPTAQPLGFRAVRELIQVAKWKKMGLLVGSFTDADVGCGWLIPKGEWFEDADGNEVPLTDKFWREWTEGGIPQQTYALSGLDWNVLRDYEQEHAALIAMLFRWDEILQRRGLTRHILGIPTTYHETGQLRTIGNYAVLPDGRHICAEEMRIMELERLIPEARAVLEAMPSPASPSPAPDINSPRRKPRRTANASNAPSIGHTGAEPPAASGPSPKIYKWNMQRS
jgi:hypothetical protein